MTLVAFRGESAERWLTSASAAHFGVRISHAHFRQTHLGKSNIHLNTRILATLSLLALAFVSPRDELLKAQVPAGAKFTKTFEEKLDLELESSRSVVDGEETPGDELDEFEMTIEASTKLVFTDHYREAGEGRPKVLARSFDSLASTQKRSMSFGDQSDEDEDDETSELEGKTVLFTWNGEEELYEPKFEDESGDEALLPGLNEDTDLRAFLPGKPVAEGDSWTVPPEAFDAIFYPGGDVALESEDESEQSGERAAQLRKNFDGDIKATFKETREEGGVRLAVVRLVCEIASHAELESSEDSIESKERFVLKLELEGELLWDLVGGHLASYQLEGDVKVEVTNTSSGEYEGESFTFEDTMGFAGTTSFECAWTAVE